MSKIIDNNMVRYRMLKNKDKLFNKRYKRCLKCGKILTDNEIDYYQFRCENCERKWQKENK